MEKVNLRKELETNPVAWAFGIAVGAFLMGIAAYEGILQIANQEVVAKHELVHLRKVAESYGDIENERREQRIEIKRLQASCVGAVKRERVEPGNEVAR